MFRIKEAVHKKLAVKITAQVKITTTVKNTA